MEQLSPALSITIVIALLAIFLMFVTSLKYTIPSAFERTRLSMTSFFCFIVATLTISFMRYASDTLPYTIPSLLVGMVVGYFVGVRTEQQKLRMHGLAYYMEHFAHIHFQDVKTLTWWSFINFYSVMGGLLMINLIGLSNIIFQGAEGWAIATCVFGAFLLGTIVPYLAHLWTVTARHA